MTILLSVVLYNGGGRSGSLTFCLALEIVIEDVSFLLSH